MFMGLDKGSHTGRGVLVLKFDLVGFSDDNSNYVYNTLVIENILNVDASCKVLIDTGASFPVWTKSTNLLHARYPQAVETPYKAWLGGFGGEGKEVPVWKIPRFVLSDGTSLLYMKSCMWLFILCKLILTWL